ncbi:sensor histidine kinase [Lederbergia graminis]|uniref:histidine kinase n=1 Tax=Lederbergia graminis TaxID=735518 RepID=A0ABW0LKA5_9BACI
MKGKVWFIRLALFSFLWIVFFLSERIQDTYFPFVLFICAVAFCLYFFLPIMKRPVILYILLHTLLFSLVFMDIALNWLTIFIFYIVLEAIFHLPKKVLISFSIYSALLIVFAFLYRNDWSFVLAIIICFILFLLISLNQYIWERKDQQYLYDQLLGEYRQLKRSKIEHERVVRLEERTRIARDIHDSVGHKLTALLMQLQMISMENDSDEYKELKRLAAESLEETRHAVKTLKNDEVAGIASVLQLIRKLEAENHLLVRFTTKQGVLNTDLSNEQSITLYRSIQEGLTNAMKHSSSREVSVTLGRSAIGALEWVISNPITSPIPFELGFGLTAMKERVEEQGGSFRVYQTEKAFVVEGSMPVKGMTA